MPITEAEKKMKAELIDRLDKAIHPYIFEEYSARTHACLVRALTLEGLAARGTAPLVFSKLEDDTWRFLVEWDEHDMAVEITLGA